MDLYEKYHAGRKLQKRILNEKNFTYRLVINSLKSRIPKKGKCLDIGCGTGALDFYLAKKGLDVTGIDISKHAIKSAKLNAKHFNLEEKTDFFVSKFPNTDISGKFDLIICSEVLEHLPNDTKACDKIYKLLKKDGVIFFSSPSKNSVLYKLGLMGEFEKRVGHLRRYDKKSFSELIKNAGFKIISVKKKQGILRDILFMTSFCDFIVRIANKFEFISDFLTLIDNSLLPFGESDIQILAKKIDN